MLNGVWGKKIGMTQIFSDDFSVVPVTAIDFSGWRVILVKTNEKDGYSALQIGKVKNRYKDEKFSTKWISSPKKYFEVLREVLLVGVITEKLEVGSEIEWIRIFEIGCFVDVSGINLGKGFQGVVKRYGFSGGCASHGHKLGRGPGALFGQTSCGYVPKGKKMPGHMGCRRHTVRNLELVKMDADANIALVKGSIPGKSGSLVFVRKCK